MEKREDIDPGGMNIFVQLLAESKISSSPKHRASQFKVEDNVGEAIHIHYRNLRFEFSVEDFRLITKNLQIAKERLHKYGD